VLDKLADPEYRQGLRSLIQIIFSASGFILALILIFGHDPVLKYFGTGLIGTLLGYWLK
jgi:hypothetical protein